MSSAGWIAVILGFLFASPFSNAAKVKDEPAGASKKHRRSLVDLSAMVEKVTGRQSPDFVGYGNWCGLGGSGHPVDPVDECCQIHDLCYDLSKAGSCAEYGEKSVYQLTYKWTAKDGAATCDEDPDKCKTAICMCDAVLANCLKENLSYYDDKNLHKLSLLDLLKEAEWISNP